MPENALSHLFSVFVNHDLSIECQRRHHSHFYKRERNSCYKIFSEKKLEIFLIYANLFLRLIKNVFTFLKSDNPLLDQLSNS